VVAVAVPSLLDRTAQLIAFVVVSAAFAANVVDAGSPFRVAALHDRSVEAAAAGALVIVAIVAAMWVRAVPSRRTIGAGMLAVALVGAVGAGYAAQRRYVQHPSSAAFVDGLDAKIGVVADAQQYPYFGSVHENRVQYVGVVSAHGGFHDITTCPAFRAAVNRGGYSYVVVGHGGGARDPVFGAAGDPLDWLSSDADAVKVHEDAQRTAFAIRGALDPSTCA
jgi:hypothetical protein